MAYELYYTAHFPNEESQTVEVFIYKKDAVAPDAVENYELTECEISDQGEGQSKYECIITRELLFTIFAKSNQSITWETFISSEHDEWKVELLIDGQYYFQGFITPDEGNGPFQDKPYEVTFRATNGLALLKGTEISDVSSAEFNGDHALIEYIAGALKKTGLDLPIRIKCGYFHVSMLNKGNGLNNDMFQQTDLNYRTFMSGATTRENCYNTLKIILDKFCTLEYWNGMWVISCIAEKQYNPNPDGQYYVDYDSDGVVTGSGIDTDNYGRIGKQMDLYPINETQEIYSKFAVKSVTTSFDYEVWPELPTNNKFERGDFIDGGSQPDEDDLDGDGDTSEIIGTYEQYTIDNWEFGKLNPIPANFPFALGAPDGTARVKRIFNQFGIEIDRQVILDTPVSNFHWLRSDPVPVTAGSLIEFSLEKKFRHDFTSGGPTGSIVAYCYVVNESVTEFWGLSTASPGGSIPEGLWKKGSLSQLVIEYAQDQDSRKYASMNVKSMAVPVNGNLYFVLNAGASGAPSPEQVFRNVTFNYRPFVAGGFVEVKGDYWFRNQAAVYPDVVKDEVFISDSINRVVKGSLLFNNQLTDAAWYRHGPVSDPNVLDETRHFKELLNIGRFNHAYRRMYALSGDFNGLNWSPDNDSGNKRPVGFYAKFREVDMTSVRDFVFVPPLKMDIGKGRINANLIEVFNSSGDGTQEGTSQFKYIF